MVAVTVCRVSHAYAGRPHISLTVSRSRDEVRDRQRREFPDDHPARRVGGRPPRPQRRPAGRVPPLPRDDARLALPRPLVPGPAAARQRVPLRAHREPQARPSAGVCGDRGRRAWTATRATTAHWTHALGRPGRGEWRLAGSVYLPTPPSHSWLAG